MSLLSVKPHIAVSEEMNTNDTVFRGTGVNNAHIPTNDPDYNLPNMSTHVYNTMSSHDLYMYDQNEIPIPITKNRTKIHMGVTNGLCDTEHSSRLPSMEGVYIVQQYIMRHGMLDGVNFKPIISLFDNEHDNLHINNEIANDVIDTVKRYMRASKVTDLGPEYSKTCNGVNVNRFIKIRVIKYIPARIFKENNSIFVPDANLVITHLYEENNYAYPPHPHSANNRAIELGNIVRDEIYPNVVGIEIIDNDNPGKYYYTSYGNEVVKLRSTTSDKVNNGFTFVTKENGIVTHNISGDLTDEDLNTMGIYHRRDEAEYNGDKKLKLENDKLALDIDKVIHDKKRMEYEADKLRVEKDKIAMERDKMIMEMEQLKIKHKFELDMQYYKLRGQQIDLVKKEVDFKANVVMKRLDLNIANIKYKTEVTKSGISIVATAITLGKTIATALA